MGAWSAGVFGNDAALDWLNGLAEAGTATQVRAIVRAPLVACATFMRDAVDGVIMRKLTKAELAAQIAESTSGVRSARERAQIEKMFRETFAVPFEDFGTREAQQAVAAATYVLWRLGGVAEKKLDALRAPAARAFAPSATLVREVRRTIELIADHKDRLRQDRQWRAKIAALREGFDAVA